MPAEKLKYSLVATGIFCPDSRVGEVRTGRHPAMNLVAEGLDMMGYRETLLEGSDIGGRILTGSEEQVRDRNGLGAFRVDHGRMQTGCDDEGIGRRGGNELCNLATPAVLFLY